MSYWLLAPDVLARLTLGFARATPEMLAAAAAAEAEPEPTAREGGLPRGLTIAGSTAQIEITGALTKRRDLWAEWFGGGNTTYPGIRQALAAAVMEPSVKSIVLAIDSPGGNVDGLFETVDAIAAARAASGKAIKVRADNAQSAAYALAAAAGPIEAVSRASSFGSIGTAAEFWVSDHVVSITNTESPDKRPDVSTPEGKATVQRYLDQLNDELVRAISRGRDVSRKTVIETFGRGASFTAPNALDLGMIDRISSPPLRAVSTKGKSKMEGNEERETARSAATATVSIEAAEARGVRRERDRVLGHLHRGEACGDMSIALEAIRSGADMSQELDGRYWAAGANRRDRAQRQTETDTAAKAVAGSAPEARTGDLGDQVVAILDGQNRSFVRE